ncbi:protein OBERON 2 isoform X1 [Populus alba x Populus x berolinensis]|nr:protein OBERON 2 isoform X1 [Populus alba x Populus x berolinensis]
MSPSNGSPESGTPFEVELMEIDKESNRSTPRERENILNLRPVAPDECGEGLPYAPEDWPNPGDTWTWRVGRRVAITGHYLDRYLYLPIRLCRLENTTRKKHGFASKLSVERYIRSVFPNADIGKFFASFSWKIPSKQSSINGNVEGHFFFPVPSEETAELFLSDSQHDSAGCKAGNKMCTSLGLQTENQPMAAMSCDICCSEPGFCGYCCCILCCKTISSKHGGYSYIKCEAIVSEGHICGHVAHMNCALRTYMAGTVGGSIGLDAEYYCRRCDARTDLVPHVTRLLRTCESVDSQDEIEKILNLGFCILRGSQRADARGLLKRIEVAITKLKCGTILEDIWKVEGEVSAILPAVSPNGNAILEVSNHQDILDFRKSSPDASMSSDSPAESLKLEDEINQVLQALQVSQEAEYKIAEERLYAQKKYLQNLYQQLDKERSELACHTLKTNPDDLLSAVLSRVDQIKREVTKLKDMEEVANGFGRTSKDILKEHFGLEVEE